MKTTWNQFSRYLLWTPFVALVLSVVQAASFTVTPTVESSPTYGAGTAFDGFNAVQSDPTSPFVGPTVHFQGWQSGGSQEARFGAYLIYRVRIEFDQPVTLNAVSVNGAGHQGGDAVMRLLDHQLNEITVLPTTGFNTPGRHTLTTWGVVGQTFYLDEFDHSTSWRFRSAIHIDASGSSNPPVVSLMPESSPTYPAGTFFDGLPASSGDALSVFDVQSVLYRGWQSGGSSEQRGSAHLIYRFRIEFDEEVLLSSVSVGGAGHQGGDAVLRILDENFNEISVQQTWGFNTYGVHTAYTGGAQGSVFYVDEFDHSTTYRYRDFIQFQFASLEPQFNPVNGNWYLAVPTPGGINWDEAQAAAEALGGFLATINDSQEQDFIVQTFPHAVQDFFGYWLGGIQPGDDPTPDADPAAGWEWVTGEPFDPGLWDLYGTPFGEPNDCDCAGFQEDAIHLWSHGAGWNDLRRDELVGGFVVEFIGDADGDGISDSDDSCPDSDLSETIVIDGCDTGVANLLLEDGCTLSDLLSQCMVGATNHGDFVSCVAELTNSLRKDGLISGKDKGAIQSCAAQAHLH